MSNKRAVKQQDAAPEANSAVNLDLLLDELIPDEPEDPVVKAYARTGRATRRESAGFQRVMKPLANSGGNCLKRERS